MATPTSSSTATATTSGSPTDTSSANQNNGNPASSSPLLFFVALGFGVVFTNLWIIVGVKYCFRYNQRNRLARAGIIDGDVDLAHLGTRPRRRREKKLMTMEEVNERFPLTKYKMWRASREAEGLPSAGGVDPMDVAGAKAEAATIDTARDAKNSSETARPPTALSLAQQDHANSMREPTATIDNSTAATSSTEKHPEKTAVVRTESANSVTTPLPAQSQTESAAQTAPPAPQVHDDDDEDEDDPIRTAAPPEMLSAPGDSCAICIDNLDDEDDVRGLTCGHAFHAACVDPWLTGRRACCPLCKADYFVPKPRGEGEETAASGRSAGNAAMPQNPQAVWLDGRGAFRPRAILAPRFLLHRSLDNAPFIAAPGERRQRRAAEAAAQAQAAGGQASSESAARTRNWMPSLPRFGRSAQQSAPAAAQAAGSATVTPSNLEAGTRR